MNIIKELCKTLCNQYTWQRITPEMTTNDTNIRYLAACIATSGDAEDRVIAAFSELDNIWNQTEQHITSLLLKHNIKYASRKASYIVNSASIVNKQFKKKLPLNRKDLESLPGVGRHIASVILATIGDQNEFAVDYHIRRIFKRLGIAPKSNSDIEYEKLVIPVVPAEKLGHFSRALVDFGQDICGISPRCNMCKFSCPSRKTSDVKINKSLPRQLFESVIIKSGQKNYAITVRQGDYHCTCTSFRFHRKCKHIDHVKTLTNDIVDGETITM